MKNYQMNHINHILSIEELVEEQKQTSIKDYFNQNNLVLIE